jgi:hypothetical protein
MTETKINYSSIFLFFDGDTHLTGGTSNGFHGGVDTSGA